MFRILTLAGGGLRGAYGIGFLREIEKQIDGPLSDYFDLIAGASTGGITAAAISYGLTAEDMETFYERHGSKIFRARPKMRVSHLGKLLYPTLRKAVSRFANQNLDDVFRSRYCHDSLEASMEEGFGSDCIADIRKCRLVIPSVNLTDGKTCVFRTPHLLSKRPEYDWQIKDVIIAATAAPTYFPHKIMPDGKSYVDGGLWANDPGLLAMAEAARILRCADGFCNKDSYGSAFDSSQVHMLSIGTGQSPRSLSPPGSDAGALYWGRHVPGLMGVLSVQGAQFPLKVALGDRYRQFDFDLREESWTLDNVEMIEDIFELGREEGRKQFESLKDTFFVEKTAPYEPIGLTWNVPPTQDDERGATADESAA